MENLQIEIESVFKLVVFCGGLIGYYFFLKNSITILNERQNQIKEKIEKLEKCAEKAEEHQNKTDNILTRLQACVENIKREMDKKWLNTSKNQ